MIRRVEKKYTTDNEYKNVLYLMTKSFRIKNNYSLYFAMEQAKKNSGELLIKIVRNKEQNERNNIFFSEMTKDLANRLKIFSKQIESVNSLSLHLNEEINAIFIDKPFLKEDLSVYKRVEEFCKNHRIALYVVDSNVTVPIRVASAKEEYSAMTLRRKINKVIDQFQETVLMDYELTIAERKAQAVLNDFIENKLEKYDLHNDPSRDLTSGLSVYLKYGFISPVTILRKLTDIENTENKEAFVEELVVRRELAYNFVYFNKGYDKFSEMTYRWAYNTMRDHLGDEREYVYRMEDYLNFRTHDEYFNAAMKEMVHLGRMHSYMRMYWCKKIIEWSKMYEEAYKTAIYLNNYYFLDGNTPNGYTGVAWCFGKHDRAWKEREIFGKLRYMNANGLKRKFDIDAYINKIENMIKEKKL